MKGFVIIYTRFASDLLQRDRDGLPTDEVGICSSSIYLSMPVKPYVFPTHQDAETFATAWFRAPEYTYKIVETP